MDIKKYGVSLSALKSLQEFQRSLYSEKRNKLAMPFHGECWFSLDDKKPEYLSVTANPGILSIDGFGVFYLTNRVQSIDETDTEVVFQGKDSSLLFKKLVITFANKDNKAHFITSIGELFDSDGSDSSGSSSSSDSVLQ